MKKYVVIGGQYGSIYYGSSDSLRGAKQIASRNAEYWDNWQGWHIPAVYDRDDVRPVSNFYGDNFASRPDAVPVAWRVYGGRWRAPVSDLQ